MHLASRLKTWAQSVKRDGITLWFAARHPQAPWYAKALGVLESVKNALGARGVVGDNKICKVSAVGVGMRSHPGVASKMFGALAAEGINIQMISTSEIRISVLIEEKYLELAVRALHKAFGLDQSE